jgi:hypothetical protein
MNTIRLGGLAFLLALAPSCKGSAPELDVFVQARWWTKQDEIPFEEYRPTPEERKAGQAFLE